MVLFVINMFWVVDLAEYIRFFLECYVSRGYVPHRQIYPAKERTNGRLAGWKRDETNCLSACSRSGLALTFL